jgi:anti-sigma B factor antagonist
MNVEFEFPGGYTVAKVVSRRLDAAAAADFKSAVGDRLNLGDHHIVLDLQQVEFIDSTGLGAILSVLKKVPADGTLALACCGPNIIELIRLTRLERVLPRYATIAAAAAAIAPS